MTFKMPSVTALLSCAITLLPLVSGQTFTTCNPLNRTDCPLNPALSTNATFNWTNAGMPEDKLWNTTAGQLKFAELGAEFTVARSGDSPTLASNFYLFGGVVSIVMKAAKGQGIVSSMVLQSEDLDEVDWEFLGGNSTHVLTNYFGKGDTSTYDRGKEYEIDNPMENFHNYTVHWTKEKIEWWIGDKLIRTLNAGEANGGKNFPQTPMNIRLGIWAGGDPEKNKMGVVEWAGGETNFDEGPFTMTIASVYAKDFSTGKEYKYGDQTGNWDSIEIIPGQSRALEVLTTPQGVSGRWHALSQGAKIGIGVSVAGVAVIAAAAFLFIFFRRRRVGRREAEALLAVEKAERAELDQIKTAYVPKTSKGTYTRLE